VVTGFTITAGGTGYTSAPTVTFGPPDGPHTDYHALAFDENGNLIVGNDGGVWRLDSNDITTPKIVWTDLNGNLDITQFYGIGLDPTNANIAYGGSQDNGTEKFTGALTWAQVQVRDREVHRGADLRRGEFKSVGRGRREGFPAGRRVYFTVRLGVAVHQNPNPWGAADE
jgi:hypothetical protein